MLQLPQERKLFKVAKYFNISKDEIVEYLKAKGFDASPKPSFELTDEMIEAVAGHFAKEAKAAERIRTKVEQFDRHRSPTKKDSTAPEQPQKLVEKPTIEEITADTSQSEIVSDSVSSGHATVSRETVTSEPTESPSTVVEEIVFETDTPTAAEVASQQIELHTVAQDDTSSAALQPTEESVSPVDKDSSSEILAPIVTTETEFTDSLLRESTTAPELIEEPTDQSLTPSQAATTDVLTSEENVTPPIETTDETGETKRRRRLSNVIATSEPDSPSTSWKLRGLTVVGKIELPVDEPRRGKRQPKKPDKESQPQRRESTARTPGKTTTRSTPERRPDRTAQEQRPPLFIDTTPSTPLKNKGKKVPTKDDLLSEDKAKKKRKPLRELITEEEVERAIRETLAGIEEEARIKSKIKKQRKQQREERQQRRADELKQDHGVLRITEYLTTAELANFLGVSPAEVIAKCLGLGLMVSINQRLDRDTIQLIASDYGIEVEFLTDKEVTLDEETIPDPPESLVPRPPIVTIMGHVDHGKTSLLDYIRSSNIVAGEAGGITQHIGAYKVILPSGKSITFLDTPGHEAFTAMRARGAQVTDIVVLVVAADDSVMPQTVEAIRHALAAAVPIVVAINKIDKETANPDRIKQQLADHGILVEEWGGKYQCAEISAKKGINVDVLLEKILLEAELLELKANPNRTAIGTVIEAHVDKGRGNVATVLVQNGTLHTGDTFICGQYFGRVRAMYDERGNRVEDAPPSTPVQVTGFEGLPEAGDKLVVSTDEDKLRQLAQQRQMLRREQQLRQIKRISLDELSKRMQQGDVKELRIVLKADMSGSLEALSDALQKLSTDEVSISIIHHAVGAISESDVMLAAASDAIVVGFQVQLPALVRRVAERENVDVRLYSIIYDALNEIKLALEGMLSPETKEEVLGRAEVRQVFRISKVGTVAGCYVLSGTLSRNDKVRIIRDGFEIYKGTIQSLKHLKDDVREVRQGFECGMTISGFHDYSEGDIIEAYRITEVQRKLGQ
jgi:translation initiation factor IF-2